MNRQSNYNYFVPYNKDKIIYYNAVTHNSFTMSLNEHKHFQELFSDPISFELEYPTAFKNFIELGFFVEEGKDEIAPLRFMYNKDVLYSSEIHIILNFKESPNEDFIEIVKKHISNLVISHRPPILCIEWNGIYSLLQYEDILIPLYEYIKIVCNKHNIMSYMQLVVEIEMSEVIHDKMHHDKGIPTYKNIIKKINALCRNVSDILVLLKTGFEVKNTDKKITFMKQFSNIDRLIFQWKQKNYETDMQTDSLYVVYCNDEIEDKRWYNTHYPRINQYLITNNGNVYYGTRCNSSNNIIGTLNNDGNIKWNEKRIKTLGSPWFETERCRECKHLFLFSNICPHIKNQTNQELCFNDLNIVDPEKIIIQEFEHKNDKQISTI